MRVEDEWERELEADQDLDLLFVTYDDSQVSLDTIKETIREHGFEPEVKD